MSRGVRSRRPGLPGGGPRRRQRGFSAVLVLAVVVMMGSLIAYGVTLTTATSATLSQDILSARVLQAARAGLEWGRYRLRTAGCVAANANVDIPLTSGNFRVTVRCSTTSPTAGFDEGGTVVKTHSLTATACSPAPSGGCPDALSDNYVERMVTGIAEGP